MKRATRALISAETGGSCGNDQSLLVVAAPGVSELEEQRGRHGRVPALVARVGVSAQIGLPLYRIRFTIRRWMSNGGRVG
jgi:hypothetical protein